MSSSYLELNDEAENRLSVSDYAGLAPPRSNSWKKRSV